MKKYWYSQYITNSDIYRGNNGEMKTIMRYHFISTKLKSLKNTKCYKDMDEKGLYSYILGPGLKNVLSV